MATPILWGEFRVNAQNDGLEKGGRLHALGNGQFVTVWERTKVVEPPSETEPAVEVSTIHAQFFYSGAVPRGETITVNTTQEGTHKQPAVTILKDGRYLFVWEHHRTVTDEENPSNPPVDEYSIRARLFNADGTPYDTNGEVEGGTEDFVVASGSAPLTAPLVEALSDGGFAVTYNHADGDSGSAGVKVAVYSHDGNPLTDDSAVNSAATEGFQNAAALVSLSGNRFLAFYSDEATADDGLTTLRARFFSTENGTVSGADETGPVISDKVKEGTTPAATQLADGRIIVVWTEENNGATNVMAQLYRSDMTPVGNAFVVNKTLEGDQYDANVTALAKGGFAISYLESTGAGAPQVRVATFDNQGIRQWGDDKVLSKAFDAGERSAPSLIELRDGRLIVAWDEAIEGRTDDTDGIWGQVYDGRTTPYLEYGTPLNDQWVGTHLNDTLYGAGGNDHLNGREGNDILIGGDGWDTMVGGTGDDLYYMTAGDMVVEEGLGGYDTIIADFSAILGDNTQVEVLQAISGMADLSLGGGNMNDTLIGNDGHNVINGGSGADMMNGGAGNDTYYVDNQGDVIADTSGTEMVVAAINYTLADIAENLTALTGAGAIALKGNTKNNMIVGNEASNKINGGSGSDKIWGGFGKDVLTGSKGKDFFAFNTKPQKKNVDKITDFKVKDDTIWLDHTIFAKLGKKGSPDKPKKINKKFFTIGAEAKDKNDFIIYNDKTGSLYYDANGSGKGKMVEIAKLKSKLALTEKDFFLI